MSKRAVRSIVSIAIILSNVYGGFLVTQPRAVEAATACNVTYTVQNQWQGGFTVSVSISNPGSTNINGWMLGFTFANGQQVSQGWNATWSQSGANVTAQNLSYNSTIGANSSVSLGFNGSWTGSNTSPTSFTLNGSACNGSGPTPTPTMSGPTPTPTAPSGGQKEPACAPGLPANTGTNYPTPNDPHGFGAFNQSIVGWEGNTYAPFAYLSGAFFARGVTASTYTAGGTSYCGAMYSFGVYTYGLNGGSPAAGSVQWTMDNGYLPALTTSFTRNNVAISIKNFADQVTISGSPFEIVYSRVAVTNNGSSAVS